MDGGEEEGKEGACFPDSYTQAGPWVCLRQACMSVSLQTDFLDISICSVFISVGGIDSGKGWGCCLAEGRCPYAVSSAVGCPRQASAQTLPFLGPSQVLAGYWAVGRDLGGELA